MELITRPEFSLRKLEGSVVDWASGPLSRAKFSLPDWYQPAFSLAPATSPLLRLGRGWVLAELEDVDVWRIVWGCKTKKEFFNLFQQARSNFAHIEKLCNGDVDSLMRLRMYGARMMALGIIRGLQFGSQIGSKVEGTIAASISGHASVARLLVEEPKASSLDVCRALDKVNEPLPWLKLSRVSRFWEDHAKTSTVKMAITLARKAALQSAADEEFIALIRGIGDEGTVFERFQFTKRAVAKHRK